MFILNFLRQQQKNQNSGFALALVLGISTIMSLTITAMLIRTANQKNSSQALQDNFQAHNAAKTAETRVRNLLTQYPFMLLSTPDLWEKYLKSPDSSPEAERFNKNTRLCKSDSDWNQEKKYILKYAQGEDINLENFSFYLVDFSHLSNNKAQITVSAETANGSRKNLQAQIQFEFVYPNGKDYAPALWVQEAGLGRSVSEGDFFTNDCQVNVDDIRMKKGYEARHVPFDFPALPDLFDVDFDLTNSHKLTLDNSIEAQTMVFPRPDEQTTKEIKGRKIYEYIISGIDTNATIEFNSMVNGESVTIILYIKGKVDKAKITHLCGNSTNCPAENLLILGYGSSTMCFVTDKLNAFIFAPYSEVGFQRNRRREFAEIRGSIWTKKLGIKDSCEETVNIFQSIERSKLPLDFQVFSRYPRIIELSKFKTVDSSIIDSYNFVKPPIELPPPIPENNKPFFIDDNYELSQL